MSTWSEKFRSHISDGPSPSVPTQAMEEVSMLGLFRRARTSRKALPASRARLSVEPLEDRYCPAAPTIMSLTAQHSGTTLYITGSVSDEQPAQASVVLSGAVSVSLTPDSAGMFSYQTPYTSGTQVTAQATDVEGLTATRTA